MSIDNIIISCNKNDVYLTRICVASIRYFYPQINIFLIKDYANGNFETVEIESNHSVKILDLGLKDYGWAGAKMHLFLTKQLGNHKYLSLDSDIVFCGTLMDMFNRKVLDNDIIVNADFVESPYNEYVKETYYDYDKIRQVDKSFSFPGYVFNTGQMVITPGCLSINETQNYFDLDNYPRWKRMDLFPLVDQSLLNYLIPKKEKLNELSVGKINFMLWFNAPKVAEIDLKVISNEGGYPLLIHWAGAFRTPYISKMYRSDILSFFESYYYSKVKYGFLKRNIRKIIPITMYYLRKLTRVLRWRKS